MRRLLAAAAALFALRLALAPMDVDSLDAALFVRGVERYSVAEHRPHWPGYPVYIAAGKVLHAAGLPPVVALHVLSAAAWSACAVLVAALAWQQAGATAALSAGIVWALAPGSWLAGGQILSDLPALALALGTWWRAARPPRDGDTGGAVLAGLTLGVRPTYGVLLLPWVAEQIARVRGGPASVRRGAPLSAAAGGALVAAWLAWQLTVEPSFFAHAAARVHGHLGNWAHRIGAWPGRQLRWTAETFVVYGIGGWWPGTSTVRLGVTALVIVALAAGIDAVRRQGALAGRLALWVLPHALVVLLANDPRLVRYHLPWIAAAAIVVGLGAARMRAVARPFAAALALALGAVTLPLHLRSRAEPPLPAQIAAFARGSLDPRRDVVLVTEDAAPVRIFLEDAGQPVEEATHDALAARARTLRRDGRVVYATAPPRIDPQRWELAVVCARDRLLESRGPREYRLYRYLD